MSNQERVEVYEQLEELDEMQNNLYEIAEGARTVDCDELADDLDEAREEVQMWIANLEHEVLT